MKEPFIYDEVLGWLKQCDRHGPYWTGKMWGCPRCQTEMAEYQIRQLQAYIRRVRAQTQTLMMTVPFRRLGDMESEPRKPSPKKPKKP